MEKEPKDLSIDELFCKARRIILEVALQFPLEILNEIEKRFNETLKPKWIIPLNSELEFVSGMPFIFIKHNYEPLNCKIMGRELFYKKEVLEPEPETEYTKRIINKMLLDALQEKVYFKKEAK